MKRVFHHGVNRLMSPRTNTSLLKLVGLNTKACDEHNRHLYRQSHTLIQTNGICQVNKLLSNFNSDHLIARNPQRQFYLDSSRQNEDSKTDKELFDTLGAWEHKLELPIKMDASIKHGAPIPYITKDDVGCFTLLGKRKYQEDRYVICDLQSDILCCAVFDGHGGAQCAEYCSTHLEALIKEELQDKTDLQEVLNNVFLKLHSSFAQSISDREDSSRCGSTATVCLLRGGVELVVGHVGDSSALLSRLGTARRLTVDHCPSVDSEKERIEKLGGKVSVDNVGRHMVNNSLNMSRSIGDIYLKSQGVIAEPEVKRHRIKHGKDSFLLLVTDGITFMMTDKEICSVINNAQDPATAAKQIAHQAISMSSEDNCTAVVVPLGSWGKYTTSASMFYSFGIGRDMAKSSRFG